ncbi:hypothetical protein HDA32_003707 [Spinactinospora alkalitolerans]|uniref:DUF397 domain-containing protein n=1 Tax=Spinactinospora alkalitolerans TaxID=687207 RepID=A0A852TZ53_9ACTN|nr:DUF397 domain-containing protein [Spinactinospora alkalitolerans]NYE48587.1 hypothetical protein [Spinactinospora alkalitolerans]
MTYDETPEDPFWAMPKCGPVNGPEPAARATERMRPGEWVKSSYSQPSGGNCLETARLDAATWGMRDSRDRTGPHLELNRDAWLAFIATVRRDGWD